MDIDPITLKRINPLICGIIIAVIIPFIRKLFPVNLWVYRKLGWDGLADRYERKKENWIRTNQWICGILAVALILAAFLFPDEWAQYFRIP